MAAADRSATQQRLIALLGPAAQEYLERLADTDRSLSRQVRELFVLVREYGPEAVSAALAKAHAARAFGADYIANILRQQQQRREVQPLLRFKDPALNELATDPLSLAQYDAFILRFSPPLTKGYFDSIPHDKLLACVRMRVVDRSVLKLIRMWLESPVVEPGGEGQPGRGNRPCKGTPQGGVISPLLSNLYLHWFDKLFHRAGGPAHWAGAKLVRYADDFVVLARYQGNQLTGWVESKLVGWLGLEINREKTRVVNLKEEGASLNFLGFTFRYCEDL